MLQIFQEGILAGDEYPSLFLLFLPIILTLVVSYLLGSINTAILVSRHKYGADIRQSGSGNAGLTNMRRVYGNKAAVFVLVGDMLKMVLSLLFAAFMYGFHYMPYAFCGNFILYLSGLCCILGHIFPIFYHFKGGKGVLCTVTMVLILSPIVAGAMLIIFALLLLTTHYVSLSSITAGLFYPLLLNRLFALFYGEARQDGVILVVSIVVALLILYCHRSNIVRIKEHRENKFYFRKRD